MLRLVLFPFAILFDLVTSVRNRLYDRGLKPAATFEVPVISVGNLTVGGTGKTPMMEYIIRLLIPRYRIAALSRGYGRATKGFRIAGGTDDASTIGDEPLQLYRNFRDRITVAVGEERALAIPHILHEHPDTEVILLDDAFQHRKVKPSFQILLTDWSRLFYRDYVLPAGRLRESRSGASRADVIVVTKCPREISEGAMAEIEKSIHNYAQKPVFFTTIQYGKAIALARATGLKPNVVLVSGIANHEPFEQYAKKNYAVLRHFVFPDHHVYTPREVESIVQFAAEHNASIVTTEKDAVKLNSPKFEAIIKETSFFYLPIEIEFLKNGQVFDELVFNLLQPHAS
jgi:tetraacyldisaccharide 4'-kinase